MSGLMRAREIIRQQLFDSLSDPDVIIEALAGAGYQICPIEPSEKMKREGESAASFGIGKAVDDEAIVRVWEWMLKASLNEEG